MTTLLEPKTTLAYLAYLGYPGRVGDRLLTERKGDCRSGGVGDRGGDAATADTASALKIVKAKKVERRRGKKTVARNVFQCYVFGAAGSGKTAFLRSFVRKKFSDAYAPTVRPYSVVNTVEIQGCEKHLVLREFGSRFEAEVLASRRKLEQCDLLCFVYDSSDVNSFAYVTNLRVGLLCGPLHRFCTLHGVFAALCLPWLLKICSRLTTLSMQKQYDLDHLPNVFLATKSDLDLVQQVSPAKICDRKRYEEQPDVYCRLLGLAVPTSVSAKDGQMADIFNILTDIAMHP
ncbi:MAG: P-loop containing nucleoside triphosphate hydrolase protein [Olpidium bornovanus]|uniref:P-loop containing nucleoside triphosphate hydrolase protein n=1 Tax=Olpidium bornovanus TaxID=278681 RepID=A0A8H7ZQG7_9FUNG|nr:MAG: P-loop containing nucleoside triphosphate hydrolase protein [Olpidium bornovanus]